MRVVIECVCYSSIQKDPRDSSDYLVMTIQCRSYRPVLARNPLLKKINRYITVYFFVRMVLDEKVMKTPTYVVVPTLYSHRQNSLRCPPVLPDRQHNVRKR